MAWNDVLINDICRPRTKWLGLVRGRELNGLKGHTTRSGIETSNNQTGFCTRCISDVLEWVFWSGVNWRPRTSRPESVRGVGDNGQKRGFDQMARSLMV